MLYPARALAIAVLLLGAGSSARAAPVAEEARAKEAKEAKEHFASGQTHYSLGEFTEAAAEFREAYRLLPEPAILFNIAQAMRQMNDFRHAYFYYSQYLSRRPDAANRTDVEGFISAMKLRMDEEDAQKSVAPVPLVRTPIEHAGSAQSVVPASPAAAPSVATAAKSGSAQTPPAHGFWSGLHIAGVAAGGAALAAGGLALAFHSSAASSADTLNQKYQAGTLTPQDAGLKSDVASKGTAATACVIGAAVLVAAGSVLVFAF